MKSLEYSSVPNRRACTFIDFEKKIPPARSYFGLHVYWFSRKFPPCTSIPSYTFNVFEDTLDIIDSKSIELMISKVPKVGADAAMHSFSVFMQWLLSTALIFCSSDITVFVSEAILGKRKDRGTPLHGLILVCTFIDFPENFLPARLFHTARLMFFLEFFHLHAYFVLHVYSVH